MLLMGIVKVVHPTHLLLSLPGRLVGRVSITHISKAYSSSVKDSIENQDDDDEPSVVSSLETNFYKLIKLIIFLVNPSRNVRKGSSALHKSSQQVAWR